jgi:hypothetical protein
MNAEAQADFLRVSGLVVIVTGLTFILLYVVAGFGIDPLYDYYFQIDSFGLCLIGGMFLFVAGVLKGRHPPKLDNPKDPFNLRSS